MTQEALEKKVKAVGKYLSCNENELWSEMKALIQQHTNEVIGENEKLNPTDSHDQIRIKRILNERLDEIRIKAGLSQEGDK